MQSAALLIVKKGGGVWLNNDVVARLQVDDNPEPIKELRRLVEKSPASPTAVNERSRLRPGDLTPSHKQPQVVRVPMDYAAATSSTATLRRRRKAARAQRTPKAAQHTPAGRLGHGALTVRASVLLPIRLSRFTLEPLVVLPGLAEFGSCSVTVIGLPRRVPPTPVKVTVPSRMRPLASAGVFDARFTRLKAILLVAVAVPSVGGTPMLEFSPRLTRTHSNIIEFVSRRCDQSDHRERGIGDDGTNSGVCQTSAAIQVRQAAVPPSKRGASASNQWHSSSRDRRKRSRVTGPLVRDLGRGRTTGQCHSGNHERQKEHSVAHRSVSPCSLRVKWASH